MIYKDTGSYPLYRIKGTNTISPFVGDLAKIIGAVNINQHAIYQIKKYGRLIGFHSVFNEIEWINPWPDIKNNRKNIAFSPKQYSADYWADLFIEYLMHWVKSTLKPDKEYWILHSSGGDSRIISGILAKARDEYNISLNIKFVSWYPEAEQSEKILKFLGWQNEFIWNVGDDAKGSLISNQYWNRGNYYSFSDCGYYTNGEIQPFGSSQANFWKPYYKDVSSISIIMALLGDVVMGSHSWLRWAKRYFVNKRFPPYSCSLKWNVIISGNTRWNGLGNLGYLHNFDKFLTPTLDNDFVNVGVQIPYICRYNDNIRKRIQEKLKPGLSKFKNDSCSWTLQTENILENSYADYLNSEFYKKYKYNNFDFSKGDQALPYLSIASLHDYLIKENVEIY